MIAEQRAILERMPHSIAGEQAVRAALAEIDRLTSIVATLAELLAVNGKAQLALDNALDFAARRM